MNFETTLFRLQKEEKYLFFFHFQTHKRNKRIEIYNFKGKHTIICVYITY